jgi:rhamnosyltransferase
VQSVCAVMVTHHPDGGLVDRILRIAPQVAQTVIVDNGSSASCMEPIRKLTHTIPVYLILNRSNEGIASALNVGTRWAASEGFRWVLTLDQDTTVLPDMMDVLAEVVRFYPFPERLAVIGSNYRDKVNGTLFCEPTNRTDGFPGREMTSVLTSGSLISIDAFQKIGGFRDDFFIDCVDHEYCLRARARGFHVVLTSAPVMEHGIGHLTEHRLLWRKVHTSNHSPVRVYFTTRNILILAREYLAKEPRWIIESLLGQTKSILLVCLFERDRISKMKYALRGCIDGVLGRTGSLSQPIAGRNR